jgi:hypothetical protein
VTLFPYTTLFRSLGLLAFLFAKIGYHHAQGLPLVSGKPVKGQINRDQTSICATQVEFALCIRLTRLREESFESVSLCFLKQ